MAADVPEPMDSVPIGEGGPAPAPAAAAGAADETGFAPALFVNAQVLKQLVLDDGMVHTCVRSESGALYQFVRTLKTAIYGKVKHAVRLREDAQGAWRTEEQFAIKIISKERMMAQRGVSAEDPLKELAAQQLLSAPGNEHVLGIVETLQDNNYIFAVLPFCDGGELFGYVKDNGAFPEPQARHYFVQLLDAIAYLQRHRVCHRDLSLENVLVRDGGRVAVVIDFGMCLRVPEPPQLLAPSGRCGKLNYMAPEIFLNQAPFDGFKVDVWAAGVILFIMVTGVPIYDVPHPEDSRFNMVAGGGLSEMLDLWQMPVSPGCRELLQGILQADPARRPTVEQVMGHPWVSGGL